MINNISASVFKYIMYILITLLIIYFLAKMFEYNDGRLFDAVGISSNKIEGMSVKDKDKAVKVSENLDLYMDKHEEDGGKKLDDYLSKVPQELKDAVREFFELSMEGDVKQEKKNIYIRLLNTNTPEEASNSLAQDFIRLQKTSRGIEILNKIAKKK